MKLLLAFILFSIASSITPGPNNIMIMSSGLNFGINRSFPHFMGICLGFPLMVLIVGIGMGKIFMYFPLFHKIIKIFGAIYWKISQLHLKVNSLESKKPLSFLQAVATYTTPHNMMFQIILISLIFMLTCFPAVGIWMCFGSILKYILKNDAHRRYFNYMMSLLLVVSILLIFIE